MELTHLSLFSGIGGIDIAAEWAGFKTVCFVENNEYCQKVLRKHWPDVPIRSDIHDFHWREAVKLITGGFPCQPVSFAGKRRGKEDDRWLWPEMLRVIKEVRPRWVVAENVAGLIRMGIDDCISDLENIGYTTEPYLIPACAVNAPHRRDRIFIVAHSKSERAWGECGEVGNKGWEASQEGREGIRQGNRKAGPSRLTPTGGDVENTDISRNSQSRIQQSDLPPESSQDVADTKYSQTARQRENCGEIPPFAESEGLNIRSGTEWWAVEPNVGRVAYGIPSRVDRLRGLGNAVVPQQIYPILKAIADFEHSVRNI